MIRKLKTDSHADWLALRRQYLGGSDAAAVVGMNPFSSRYSLWAEKTGLMPGFSGNLATEVGTYLEEFVARKFAEVTGKNVRKCNRSLLNTDYPWAIANIDREVIGEDAGLEIKTTSELNLKKFGGGEFPTQYYAQMLHYMAVTGKKRWYLAVLVGNREFLWYCIDRDGEVQEEIDLLMAEEKAFWNLVQTKIPPEVDGSDATTRTLGQLYPEGDDSTVALYDGDKLLAEYTALGVSIKDLKTRQEALANQIKAEMQDSGRGESERFRVSWLPQSRKKFDLQRFAQDKDLAPDELIDYYNETTTRVFRVREKKEG